jgi:hypothetical protein
MNLSHENHWHLTQGVWADPDLQRVKMTRLRYFPRPFTQEDCVPDAVCTLRGPRRAGKTVALKLLIASLIESKAFSPREIYWTSFEALRTLSQIEEKLRELWRLAQPRILFIDEVTAVVGWQRVIKKLKDEGYFAASSLFLTGSSAYDLRAGAERMAGRRGFVANPDRVLLPMSFRSFYAQVKDALPGQSVEQVFCEYLKVGGFPFRVDRYLAALAQNQPFDLHSGFEIFDDIFFYEINRRKLDRNIALEVLGRLTQTSVHAISYEGFSKNLTVSRETIKRYLDALGDSFLLATVSSFDTGRGRVAPKKDRKFIWVDPALAEYPMWAGAGKPLSEPDRAEMAVGMELIRRYELRKWEGLSAPRNVFTWKSSSGNEIDFLRVDASQGIREPFEVKYQTQIRDADFQVIEKSFGKGILLTINESRTREKGVAMPAGTWCLSWDTE